jgi:hypothetical protein
LNRKVNARGLRPLGEAGRLWFVTDRARRAAARAHWTGLKTDLTSAAGAEDLCGSTTAQERVLLVEALTAAAWSLSGRSLPTYARSEMPGLVVRPTGS